MINLLRHFNERRTMQHSFFSFVETNDPRWTPSRYDKLSEEGYQKNAVAFRAINLISRGIASIPIRVVDSSTGEENAAISALLSRVNAQESGSSFIEKVVNYLLISGNAFIHCKDDSCMHCLRPDRVRIIPDRSQLGVEAYSYSVDNTKIIIDKDEILHLKFFNPIDDWYGLGPLQVTSRAIDQHNAISDHNMAILQNGGRPSGCLIVKSSSENMSAEQREQLRSEVRDCYAGALNAGKMMVLEGNFEWKEMGLSPKDLDFSTGKNISSREIALVFGVPPMLVGLPGDTAFGTYKEARLHLWEDTILPLADLIRSEFAYWLSRKFHCDIKILLDLDAISALASKREILWRKISDANFLTLNEKRRLLGFDPIEEGEKI